MSSVISADFLELFLLVHLVMSHSPYCFSCCLSLGLHWHCDWCMWQRPGLPHLCQISGPFQNFKSAILDAWRGKVSAELSSRIGFGDGRFLDLKGSLKLVSTPHLRCGGKGLLRDILSGGGRNGFFFECV